MKKGKIGSALAAFESNIAQNIKHGAAGSKSFLTGIASTNLSTVLLNHAQNQQSAQQQPLRGSCHGASTTRSADRRSSTATGTTATKPSPTATGAIAAAATPTSKTTPQVRRLSTGQQHHHHTSAVVAPATTTPAAKSKSTAAQRRSSTGQSQALQPNHSQHKCVTPECVPHPSPKRKTTRKLAIPTTSSHASLAPTPCSPPQRRQSISMKTMAQNPSTLMSKTSNHSAYTMLSDAPTEAMTESSSYQSSRSSSSSFQTHENSPQHLHGQCNTLPVPEAPTDPRKTSKTNSTSSSSGEYDSAASRTKVQADKAIRKPKSPKPCQLPEQTVPSNKKTRRSNLDYNSQHSTNSQPVAHKRLSLHFDSTNRNDPAAVQPLGDSGNSTVAAKSICSAPVLSTSTFSGLRIVQPQDSFSSLPLRPKSGGSAAASASASTRYKSTTLEALSSQLHNYHHDEHEQEEHEPFMYDNSSSNHNRLNSRTADREMSFADCYVSSPNKKSTGPQPISLPFIPQSPASTVASETPSFACDTVHHELDDSVHSAPQYQDQVGLHDGGGCTSRKMYPRSPMPKKSLLRANAESDAEDGPEDHEHDNELTGGSGAGDDAENYEDESSDTFHDSHSTNLMTKLSRVQKAKRNGVSSTFSSDDVSLCTLDLHRRPVYCPKSSTDGEDSLSSIASSTLYSSFASSMDTNAVVHKSKYTKQVFSILRRPPMVRNTMRRVTFADLQPGGGRRMNNLSDHSSTSRTASGSRKRDAQPMRPRRSRQSTMDQLLKSTAVEAAALSSNPQARAVHHKTIILLHDLAATRIQALVRQRIQWAKTRVTLLERKLIRIEASRLAEVAKIREQKWRAMETMQSENAEAEKRFESQMALGEKLMDHLKRDSTLVKGQNKKMQEFMAILKRNKEEMEKSVCLNNDNFFTMNIAIKLLREKSDILLDDSKKYATSVDKIQCKLQETSRQVDAEVHAKRITELTIKRMLSLIKTRSKDKLLLNHISDMLRARYDEDDRLAFAGNGSFVMHDVDSNDEANAFELSLKGHDNDDMSVFSDITDMPGQSSAYTPVFDVSADFTRISEGQETVGSDSSIHLDDLTDDEDDRTSDSSSVSSASSTSFASYNPSKIEVSVAVHNVVPSTPRKDSFADYDVPSTPRKDSFADYTPTRPPNTPGNASAPRRHLSNEGSIR